SRAGAGTERFLQGNVAPQLAQYSGAWRDPTVRKGTVKAPGRSRPQVWQRSMVNAPLALGHALAVPEGIAREVPAHLAVVADHDADVSDRHHRFGDHLDRGE